MPFTVKETRTYPYPPQTVFTAALDAVRALEGKILSQDAEAGTLEVRFPKTILGKVLGDRTHLTVQINSEDGDQSTVYVEIYPLDAIGRRLQFGARKGVPQTVMRWFFAHLERRLPAA